MALIKLKVTYIDGREEKVIATPKAQLLTERKFGSTAEANAREVESSLYLAWASLHHAGREPNDFEEFTGLVADAEMVQPDEEDEKAADPTPTVPGTTGSSD